MWAPLLIYSSPRGYLHSAAFPFFWLARCSLILSSVAAICATISNGFQHARRHPHLPSSYWLQSERSKLSRSCLHFKALRRCGRSWGTCGTRWLTAVQGDLGQAGLEFLRLASLPFDALKVTVNMCTACKSDRHISNMKLKGRPLSQSLISANTSSNDSSGKKERKKRALRQFH